MRRREGKYHQGRFNPRNPEKYKGRDIKNIIYRSSWELIFMRNCDRKENILEWGSEEFFIPYFDPTTRKVRRYFPDFYMKVRDRDGVITRYIVEVKPKRQVKKPQKTPKKKEKTFLNEVITWEKNQAKWKAAQEFCEDRMFKFKIITEDELGL
jgi:hypothetical protein